jgi:alpha-galactosidase
MLRPIAAGLLAISVTPAAVGQTTAPAALKIPDLAGRILTPRPPETPRINGLAVFGVRPGSPVLYHVPVTGAKPVTYAAEGLPAGITLDAATGNLTGSVREPGTYRITLRAANARGRVERAFRLVVGDAVGLTPPMGWNSYNVWSDQVTQERALDAARAMVAIGLIDHGWTYINLDDGWQGQRGGPLKALQPDPRKFQDMKTMANEIHALGLKVGIYYSPWVVTYAGRLGVSAENPDGAADHWPLGAKKNAKQLPFAIGKYRFTDNDAKQFAEWGHRLPEV